jgi:DNA-damage-inducible protein D
MEQNNKVILFQDKQIRRTWHNEQWYLSIVDVVEILTDSPSPKTYWAKLKKKLSEESGIQEFRIWEQLKMLASDGKNYKTDAANTEGVFRIIMSVSSPKAEPFKQWLAQVGKERIEEVDNPELGFERLTEIYKAQGRTDEWIKNRLQTIETRKRLTDEWKQRGVLEGQEYSILTATIAKGTFGLTPNEHGKLKGLERQNLRDHMSPLELIFTALSEEATRIHAEDDDARGFNENHDAARKGGETTGAARQLFEQRTGRKVVSNDNFLLLKKGGGEGELPKADDDTEKI